MRHAREGDGGGTVQQGDCSTATACDGDGVGTGGHQWHRCAVDGQNFAGAVSHVTYRQRQTREGLAAFLGRGDGIAKQHDGAVVFGEGGGRAIGCQRGGVVDCCHIHRGVSID